MHPRRYPVSTGGATIRISNRKVSNFVVSPAVFVCRSIVTGSEVSAFAGVFHDFYFSDSG